MSPPWIGPPPSRSPSRAPVGTACSACGRSTPWRCALAGRAGSARRLWRPAWSAGTRSSSGGWRSPPAGAWWPSATGPWGSRRRWCSTRWPRGRSCGGWAATGTRLWPWLGLPTAPCWRPPGWTRESSCTMARALPTTFPRVTWTTTRRGRSGRRTSSSTGRAIVLARTARAATQRQTRLRPRRPLDRRILSRAGWRCGDPGGVSTAKSAF
mmetsp:Transcript_51013/g.141186  ORF Transcript_51013/g.141186 Transcript_51013/m.141186 type:complete len:211 (-) Transcript_51013:17-649(-)